MKKGSIVEEAKEEADKAKIEEELYSTRRKENKVRFLLEVAEEEKVRGKMKDQGMTNLKLNVTIVKNLVIMLQNVEILLTKLRRKPTTLVGKVK